eukprot:TRINITY_DN1491_c0_g1_i4.p1 TRINITY_DN1491_c0_g1~~TRINITY_DN1491_c0_g1_i4.p1  ORF type:complete len:356 (-),score=10.19 TRINITY_DN1491_c0_g1_i4:811-1878(-)
MGKQVSSSLFVNQDILIYGDIIWQDTISDLEEDVCSHFVRINIEKREYKVKCLKKSRRAKDSFLFKLNTGKTKSKQAILQVVENQQEHVFFKEIKIALNTQGYAIRLDIETELAIDEYQLPYDIQLSRCWLNTITKCKNNISCLYKEQQLCNPITKFFNTSNQPALSQQQYLRELEIDHQCINTEFFLIQEPYNSQQVQLFQESSTNYSKIQVAIIWIIVIGIVFSLIFIIKNAVKSFKNNAVKYQDTEEQLIKEEQEQEQYVCDQNIHVRMTSEMVSDFDYVKIKSESGSNKVKYGRQRRDTPVLHLQATSSQKVFWQRDDGGRLRRAKITMSQCSTIQSGDEREESDWVASQT